MTRRIDIEPRLRAKKRRRRIVAVGLLLVILVTAFPYVQTLLYVWGDRRAFPVETGVVSMSTVLIPLAPPSYSPYALVDTWPELVFDQPTEVAFAGADSAYVLERPGRLWLVASGEKQRKRLMLDWSEDVGPISQELGAVGLALHPMFSDASNPVRDVFVWYTSLVDGKCFDKLDRIKLDSGGASVAPGGVSTMIKQLDEDFDHNGGTLKFGVDGFLYISVGDEGNCDCGNHQRIDGDLFSGVLRIDVDSLGGEVSHPPKNTPATGETSGYYIPNDNPFIGGEDALEEFWAIGLRNPFRMSFDPSTGRLFAGDVGAHKFESIVEIKKGSNHRWSIYEGEGEYALREAGIPAQTVGEMTAPLLTYPHTGMNRAVIGGVVYRGRELGGLAGRYIYGDNASGRVWELDLGTLEQSEITTLVARGDDGLVSFAVDPAGEVHVINLGGGGGGRIRKIVWVGDTQDVALPAKLSETGLFQSTASAKPADGSFGYRINREMWYGQKGVNTERFAVKLSHVSWPEFRSGGTWTISGGMAFVKTITVAGRRVETQVLITSGSDSVHGVSYRWNAAQDDADVVVEHVDGVVGQMPWSFSGIDGCATCHNLSVGALRAFNTEQLNDGDQLVELRRAGLFKTRGTLTARNWGYNAPVKAFAELLDIHSRLSERPLVDPDQLDAYPRMLKAQDSGLASEHLRAYLAVNCASCHQPGGGGGASLDARFATPMAVRGLVGTHALRPMDSFRVLADPDAPGSSVMLRRVQATQPGLQMPPIPIGLPPDPDAARLIREWLSEVKAR